MSLAELPDAFLRTILHQIAVLLLQGAGGNVDAAQQAAVATLRAFDPRTEAEFRLAARIIACSLQAGEALAQAADPTLPLTRVLRLRSGAVSLSREVEKAERRLDKLREARLMAPEQLPAVELVWEASTDDREDATRDTPRNAAPEASSDVSAAVDPGVISDEAAEGLPADASGAEDHHKIAAYAAANGLTWTEALKQRRREQALVERQRKQAMHSQAA